MSPTPGVTELAGHHPPHYRLKPRWLAPVPVIPERCPVPDRVAEAMEKATRLRKVRNDAQAAVQAATVELGHAPAAEVDEIAAALDAGKPAPSGRIVAARDALEAAEQLADGAEQALDRALMTCWGVIDEERQWMRRKIRAGAEKRMIAAREAHAAYVAALADLGKDKLALAWATGTESTNAVGLTGDSVPMAPDPLPEDLDELEAAPAPLPRGGHRRPRHIEQSLQSGFPVKG